MNSITPFLWFNGSAQEAVDHYLSVFPNSRIIDSLSANNAGPDEQSTVLVIDFELNGMRFTAMNSEGPYKFSPATSFMIHCQTQEEVDHYWDRLGEGGETMACGWLTDRFGVTWQITPDILLQLIKDPDPARSGRVMQAMMEMVKIEIAPLLRAYEAE